MKKEFRGVDGTIGFVSAWDSENPKAGNEDYGYGKNAGSGFAKRAE